MNSYHIIIVLSLIIFSHCNQQSLCLTLKYGKYCGNGYSNNYGVRPDNKLDEICHKHDICTTIGKTDSYCNCQMIYYAMNHKSTYTDEEEMRQCMLYWGSGNLACDVANYYGNSYDQYIKIPTLNLVSKGFSYYSLFNFDNISHTYYIYAFSQYLFITVFDSIDEYYKYSYLAYESGFQFALHPTAKRLDPNKYIRIVTSPTMIIVISNIRIGNTNEYNLVQFVDQTIYENSAEINYLRNDTNVYKSQLNEISDKFTNSSIELVRSKNMITLLTKDINDLKLAHNVASDILTKLTINNTITVNNLLICNKASADMAIKMDDLERVRGDLEKIRTALETQVYGLSNDLYASNIENARLKLSVSNLTSNKIILESSVALLGKNVADLTIARDDLEVSRNIYMAKYDTVVQNSTYEKFILSSLIGMSDRNIAIIATTLGIVSLLLFIISIVTLSSIIYLCIKRGKIGKK